MRRQKFRAFFSHHNRYCRVLAVYLLVLGMICTLSYVVLIEETGPLKKCNDQDYSNQIDSFDNKLLSNSFVSSSDSTTQKKAAIPKEKEEEKEKVNEKVNEKARSASPAMTHQHIILFWTPFFDWKDFQFGLGQEPFIRAGCRFTNCLTTDDRRLVNQSEALLFHPTDFYMDEVPLYRMPHQRYIFTYFEALASERALPVFHESPKGFFNWTMTHRRDSDIHSSQHYGALQRISKNNNKAIDFFPVALPPGVKPPDPTTLWKKLNTNQTHFESANKTKLIAWFSSNCVTTGRREIFFRQMAHSVPIDIYGVCGTHKCLPWKSLECDKKLTEYKFYIAAENSICPDYVTEKLYRALEAGAVPIVYGGADYSAYAPPHSYINAIDFQSPEALADYLIILDKNPALYLKYFEWKKEWQVIRSPMNSWCNLCEKLNDPTQPTKSYENITHWYYDLIPCLPGASLMDEYKLPYPKFKT